jgi:hypothetical protein
MTSFSASITTLPGKLAVSAFISILLISSCSDPASVGLELAPGNNQIGVFYREFNLTAGMVLVDSLNTTNSSILLTGFETDDFFGKTEVTAYSRMNIDIGAVRPRNDAIFDSALFKFEIVSVNGTNLDQPKKFSVFQLAKPILDTLYFNFNELSFLPTPIAELSFTFGDKKDTTISFPTKKDFAVEVFSKIQNRREIKSLFDFRKFWQGIAIKSDEGNNATIGMNPGPNTGMDLYYHYSGDTVASRYRITTFPARSFNGIKSDRSGTPTGVITERGKSYDVGQMVGMKGTLGMSLKIDTSPFDAFLDTLSGVVFNQVIFEIDEVRPLPTGQNNLPLFYTYFIDQSNRFIRRRLDNNPLTLQLTGQPQFDLDASGNKVLPDRAPAVSNYVARTNQYSLDITSYLNALYRGDLARTDWLLYGGLVNRSSFIDDFKMSLRQFTVNKDKIKVKVIYSKSR